MGIGPIRPHSRDRTVDKPLIQGTEALIVEAKLFRNTRPIVFQDHICVAAELAKNLPPFKRLKVQNNALFPAIVGPKGRRIPPPNPRHGRDPLRWGFPT